MFTVVDKIAEVLSSQPESILPLNSVGSKKPFHPGELPIIVISLHIDRHGYIGIGRFIRAGDTTVQHTGIISINGSERNAGSDFKFVRITPLPLKKNPSSTQSSFTDQDVQVRDVTDPSTPIMYSMVENPVTRNEYRLDVPSATIFFGDSQLEGAQLEISHWTITHRTEIRGERFDGTAILDIWTGNKDLTHEIAYKVQTKLSTHHQLIRSKGFIKLHPAHLDPVEAYQQTPPVGSAFNVCKQKLSYKFAFEREDGGELSSGVPISRIQVDMDHQLDETFLVAK